MTLTRNMFTYKIREKKLTEILGEPYVGYFNCFKSKQMKMALAVIGGSMALLFSLLLFGGKLLVSLPMAIVLEGTPTPSLLLGIEELLFIPLALIGLGALLYAILLYLAFRDMFFGQISSKMKDLISDPEVVWLNSEKSAALYEKLKLQPNKKRKRQPKGIFNEDTFKVLSYLKQKGGSQSIYKKITALKNSNSAYHRLKRMHLKELVHHDGIDFRYIPWVFKVVGDDGQPLKEEKKRQKIEKLLNKAWERGLETL